MPYSNKEQQKQAQANAYQKNKDYYRQVLRLRRQKTAEWLRDIKCSVSCTRCGENHPATLDFHHRDPNEKEYDVTRMAHNGWSRNKVLNEIAKCDVLCSNCHRKVHWEINQQKMGCSTVGRASGC